MGEVALRYRLMPESPAVDTARVVMTLPDVLPGDARLGTHRVVPFAFGLMAIEVLVTGPDRGGFSDDVEAALGAVAEIQSVQLQEQSLL